MPPSLSRNTLNSTASRKHCSLSSSPNQGPELPEIRVLVQSPLLEKNMSAWARYRFAYGYLRKGS